MILTLLLIIFFGYLIPGVLCKILLAKPTTDEFNNMNNYRKWKLYIDRLDNDNYNTISFTPFINLFLVFRVIYYKIFKK